MPEGPEIRNAADMVAEAIVGSQTNSVYFAFDELKPYEETLTGQEVTAVESRGKAILVRFANGLNIYAHNQLYGKWEVQPAQDEYPDTNRQLRVAIHTPEKSALLYSASEVEVLKDEELDSHPYLSKLGPDPLAPEITVEQVIDRFMHKHFHRRRFSSLLLDQEFLAGIGNYLRSEIMFVGQLHPALKPMDCTGPQIRKLAEAVIQLTHQSYQTGGITNNLELVEILKEKGYEWDDYRFWVFNREGEPCFVCGEEIVKDKMGGRRIYYCPNCQVEE